MAFSISPSASVSNSKNLRVSGFRVMQRGVFFVLVASVGSPRFLGVEAQSDMAGGLDTAVLEDNFCSSTPGSDDAMKAGLDTHSMDCGKLMEFMYVSRLKTWEALDKLKMAQSDTADVSEWRKNLRAISQASSMLSAHVHIIGAVASQRTECFSEHVRLLLIVNLRRLKGLTGTQFKQMWVVAEDGKESTENVNLAKKWLTEAVDLLDADLKTMRTVLRAWRPPAPDEARFYSHEADGRFSTMEALRRDTFKEYQQDKGLLQGLVRHVLPVDALVADFGAGSGHYASWLNDTGLVTAIAFDGSPDIELVTKGAVLGADLAKPLALWTQFDWSISIEVAEHIPADFAPTFLRNLDANSKHGVVLSWARPGLPGLGSANPRGEMEVITLVRQHTGLFLDEDLTNKLRAASRVAYLAESLFVLVREPRTPAASDPQSCVAEGTCKAAPSDLAPGCEAEEGWIYAGNDVQMFSNVETAAACCELCSTNANCKYWTWSREDSHKDLCWIKATREYRINHAGFVSGTRGAASEGVQ